MGVRNMKNIINETIDKFIIPLLESSSMTLREILDSNHLLAMKIAGGIQTLKDHKVKLLTPSNIEDHEKALLVHHEDEINEFAKRNNVDVHGRLSQIDGVYAILIILKGKLRMAKLFIKDPSGRGIKTHVID